MFPGNFMKEESPFTAGLCLLTRSCSRMLACTHPLSTLLLSQLLRKPFHHLRQIAPIIFLLLKLLPQANSQSNYLDSLQTAYLSEKDLTKRIDLLYEIANDQAYGSTDLSFAYADSLEHLSNKAGYKKGKAMALHLRGFGYEYQGDYEKAMDLFREELRIFQELKDLKETSTVFSNIGSEWGNLGNSDSCIAYYLKSLAIDEQRGDSLGMSIVYNNIGNIYSDEGVYDRAIEYFEKSLKIRQRMGAVKRYIQCYSNLSSVYGRKQDFDKAEEYANKGLELAAKFGNNNTAGVIANNLGSSYNDLKRYQDAIPWLEKALESWSAIGNESYMTYAYYNLAEAWAGLGNGAKALKYANAGYDIVQRLKLNDQLELYLKVFALAHEANGDSREALHWYKQYMALADSLFKVDNTRKVAQMEAQYQTKKKEAQIVQQQLELERRTAQKNRILVVSVIAFLILAGLFQYLRSQEKLRKKEAELSAQLEHAEAEKLREMDALKSTFFANISHEFRTPLTLIISLVEQMMNGTFKGDLQKYYRIIHRSGQRLLDLVNQLLDLSKLESGKLKLRASESDLVQFVLAIGGSFESLAIRKQVVYDIQVPEHPFNCFFDQDKVEKILVNLLSNAFKFTGEGGQICLRLLPSGEKAVLSVEDSGMGIPAKQLHQLFERFTKSTLSDVQFGSGIGLALTKELVELHGGTIAVKSQEGEGSTFTIELAVGREFFKADEIVPENEVPPMEKQPELAPPKRTFTPSLDLDLLNKPALLLVEDNPDVRTFIADTLRGEYQIVEAENGRQALEKAVESTPDLVITDLMMPEMDGMEFCRRLKGDEKTSHIPVIMLTARADQNGKLEGLQTGADDYLIKPFNAEELKVRIANLVSQRRKLQEYYRSTLSGFAPAAVESEGMDAAFLRKIKETIEANLDDEYFSVVELAKKAGMSRSQLHRKLSALTSHSPNEVIRQMRLERAKQLLQNKAGTIAEIAYLSGFSSPAYFNKCFKDQYGVTPGEV